MFSGALTPSIYIQGFEKELVSIQFCLSNKIFKIKTILHIQQLLFKDALKNCKEIIQMWSFPKQKDVNLYKLITT